MTQATQTPHPATVLARALEGMGRKYRNTRSLAARMAADELEQLFLGQDDEQGEWTPAFKDRVAAIIDRNMKMR